MKTSLFYYTGTGNSLWTARMLAEEISDAEIIPISNTSGDPIVSGAEAIGMIFPVHIWGLPRRVIAFVDALEQNGSRYYFAVAVNAGQVAATLMQLKKRMQARGLSLFAGFAVECIFTWYWVADLCHNEGIPFVLGHALYMKAIHGGKAKNDKIDSHKIAALLRGGMIPMSYVYPEKMRATRDLMRRRNHLMRKRSGLYAHIQNTNSQYNLPDSFGCLAVPKNRNGIIEQFEHPSVQESITADMEIIRSYDVILSQLEKSIINMAIHHDPVSYALLQTIPGVGKIIALIILYEVENIRRFACVQDFASYSRLVKCAKESNGKKCSSGDSKIGNGHLKWAFSEAASFFANNSDQAKKFLDRSTKKHGKSKALSILAHKLGRAVYFMLKNKEAFNQNKLLNL